MKKINLYEGVPYRLSSYMTRRPFKEILSALQYTNRTPTQQHDQFWEICQLFKVWNANMMENFIPSWINAMMNQCQSGSMNTLVLGTMNPGSRGSLVMSTTIWVVHSAMSFGRSISVRKRLTCPSW